MAVLDMCGDSITAGFGMTASTRYAGRLASKLGMTLVNRAKNGDMIADQAQKAIYAVRKPGDVATIFLGANDQRIYLFDAAKRGHYISMMRRAAFDAASSWKHKVRTTAVTKTGAWGNTVVNNFGMFAKTAGAKAVAKVSGSTVYIGYIIQNHASVKSTAQVKIDGKVVGTLSSYAAGMSTYNGQSYGPALARFAVGPGTHTVEVIVTSTNGCTFYLDYISSNYNQKGAHTFVSNVLRMTAAGYAKFGGNDANVAAYCASVAAMVQDMQMKDLMKVYLVDLNSVVLPATDFFADGIHPNGNGHIKMANKFYSVIDAVM
jgi:lysophospholipase L1-like esterase